jgi:glycosyltransferase involved in cell wall biosynthesis
VTLVSAELSSPLSDHANVSWFRAAVPRRLPTALLREQVFAIRARRAVQQAVRRHGPFDIVHSNGCAAYVRADVNIANFVHADWMKSPHHTARARGGAYGLYHRAYTWLNAAWERRAFHCAAAVVGVSELLTRSLIDDVHVPPSRVCTIVPGVDSREFRPLASGEPNTLRAAFGVPDDQLLLMFAGDARLNRKNLDLVLRAVADSGRGFHLAVAGRMADDVYPPMTKQLGIASRVHFLGVRSDLPDLLRCADVFTFPSHYDPFALVITEAMASGAVPITCPSVGAAGVVQHGQNGLLLESSSDLNGMIAALRTLDDDRARLARLATAARATACQLSWEAMAAQYEALYETVVLARGNRAAANLRREHMRQSPPKSLARPAGHSLQ